MGLYEGYLEMAREGTLPEGFYLWGLDNEDGWTVAHEAAGRGHLPEGFDQWGIEDNDGRSVADVVAGKLL